MGSQPPSGILLFWHGVLHGWQVDLCSTLHIHRLQGHSSFITVCTKGCRGISATAPRAPPLLASLTLVSVGLLAFYFLTSVSWLLCGSFYPFWNMIPHSCYQWGWLAQLWPVTSPSWGWWKLILSDIGQLLVPSNRNHSCGAPTTKILLWKPNTQSQDVFLAGGVSLVPSVKHK